MKIFLQILGVIFILQIIISIYFRFTSGELVIANGPEIPQSSTSVNHNDEELTKFLMQVLESMSIDYTEEFKGNDHWVSWVPQSEAIETEIRERVSQYNFVLKVCPKLPLPKPNESPKPGLSCTNK